MYELWSTNNKVIGARVDPPKSTMRVLHMPMHLSSGHVTLLLGKFHLP